jgi:hypothetical protein
MGQRYKQWLFDGVKWTCVGVAAPVILPWQANFAPDFDSYINATMILQGNIRVLPPTGGDVGQFGLIRFTQDGNGSRLWTIDPTYRWPMALVPTLQTTPWTTDLFYYYIDNGGAIRVNLTPAT